MGKTVQVVPHVTDAIQDWIERVAKIPIDCSTDRPDVCIIELGGTVGDIESAPFVEALRQFQFRVGPENFMVIHVSLVPVVGSVGEQKTKPTQSSVRDLRGLGLQPDVIACRSSHQLDANIKEKISMFCHVGVDRVVAVHDCASVYHVPGLLEQQGLGSFVCRRLNLEVRQDGSVYWESWQKLCNIFEGNYDGHVKIAVVGKYTYLQDSYLSIKRSLDHSSMHLGCKLDIAWIEASDLEDGGEPGRKDATWSVLKSCEYIY